MITAFFAFVTASFFLAIAAQLAESVANARVICLSE
jgi:hypothetical protein